MDDKKKPYKAYMGTALSFVGLFVAYWIADSGTFDPKEWGEAALTAAIGSGIVGAGVYKKKNPTV